VTFVGPEWTARAVALWVAGWTISAIAAEVGVTRQAVDQVFARNEARHLMPERPWVAPSELDGLIARDTALSWTAKGWVRRPPTGRLFHLGDVLHALDRLMSRQCEYPGCVEAIGSIDERHRFCAACSVEARRYRYPVMDDEERVRQVAAVAQWKANNPEAARELQRRAQRAYRARRRAGG
jgi:hypothetical protein